MFKPARIRFNRGWFRCLAAAILLATALPASSSLAGEPYHLDAQDKLRIRVIEWRAGKGEYHEWTVLGAEYQVGATGTISIPLLGEVPVQGNTTEQVAAAISHGLRQKAALVNPPDVSVEVAQFRPMYVVGNVERPGEYPFRPGLTVLKAVGIAGGLYRVTEAGLLRIERDRITGFAECSPGAPGSRRSWRTQTKSRRRRSSRPTTKLRPCWRRKNSLWRRAVRHCDRS